MGLDNFSTDDKSDSDSDLNDEEPKPPWIEDFSSYEWRMKSATEKAKYIREHYMDDYRPDLNVEDGWSYEEAVFIDCVCGNEFKFVDVGGCGECQRVYRDVGRTVRLVETL